MNFFRNPDTEQLRSGWQCLIFFLLAVVAVTVTTSILTLGAQVLHLPFSLEEGRLGRLFLEVTGSTLAVGVTSLLCFRLFPIADFPACGLGCQGKWWVDLTGGFGLGVLLLTLTVGGAWLSTSSSASCAVANPLELGKTGLLALLLFGFGAIFEELFCRGFLLLALRQGIGAGPALVVTSGLFALAHGGNPNVSKLALVNTFLAGIWLGLPVLTRKNLWGAWGLHTGWNFATVWLWGVPVSGLGNLLSATVVQFQPGEPVWLTGGGYGPEGGLFCSMALTGFIFVMFRWSRPEKRTED
ncbi:MAG: CPBP family intramembrane metalloprotease [Blastocatellia bacterium]|nr:CPBP family intramembrane metalloprotease [Blastocatellia bacterium]